MRIKQDKIKDLTRFCAGKTTSHYFCLCSWERTISWLQKVTCPERLNTDSRIKRKLPMLSLTLMIIVLEFCPLLWCMSGEMLLYEHLDQPAGAVGAARRILWPDPPYPLWATWLHNCDITSITSSYSLDNLSPEPCEGLSITPGMLALYPLHGK